MTYAVYLVYSVVHTNHRRIGHLGDFVIGHVSNILLGQVTNILCVHSTAVRGLARRGRMRYNLPE